MQPNQQSNCSGLTLSPIRQSLRKIAALLGLMSLCGLSAYAQAPGITNSPASGATVQGYNHTFIVLGTNFGGASFEWFFNDVLIPGAGTNTFTLYDVGWTNAGNYQVIVSKGGVSSTSAVAVLTVTAASGVYFDFNSSGQLTNNFNSRGGVNAADNTINFYGSAIWGEAPSRGIDNSGSVTSYATTNTVTLIHWRQPFNFSPTGAVLNASLMFKYKTPTGPRANDKQTLDLGFISGPNPTANLSLSATNAMFGLATPGPVYAVARLNMLTNSAATNAELTFEYKDLTITTRKAAKVGALTNGYWYKFSVTITNNKAAAANSIMALATIEAMGTNGTDTPTPVVSYATNFLNGSMVTNSRVFLALSPVDYYGVERFDNAAAWMRDGALGITTPPQPQTAQQNRSVSFSAGVSGTPPYYFQWMKDGGDILGATQPTYTIAQAVAGDIGSYSVRVTNETSSVVSDSAALTVTPDSTRPNLVSVGSLDGTHVGVRFDEVVASATALNKDNYTVSGGVGVNAVAFRPGNQAVELTLASSISGSFTVGVTNIEDLAGNIIEATNASGTVLNLTAFDVGGEDGVLPLSAGSSYSSRDGEISMLAGGVELGGTNDDGHLLVGPRSGDFDIKVQVQSLTRATLWNAVPGNDDMARAGLVARESSDADSRSIQITAMPWDFGNPAGYNRYEMGYRPDAGVRMTNVTGTSGTNLIAYPQGWMRLRRVNTTMSMYRSGDGLTWTNLATLVDPTLPDDLQVGLGATAHLRTDAANRPVGAEFRNYGDTAFPGAVINSVDLRPASAVIRVPASYTMTTVVSVANIPLREVQYLWQRTNSEAGGWTNIPSASSASSNYTTETFTVNDERDFSSWAFRCIVKVSGIPAVTSGVSRVTGYTDTNPPAIYLASCPSGSASNVLVYISKPAVLETLLNLSNYLITNTAGTVFQIESITLLNNGPTNAVVMLNMTTNLSGSFRIVGTGFVDNAYPPNTNRVGVARSFSGAAPLSPVFAEHYWALNTGGDPTWWDPGNLTNHAKYLDHVFDAFTYFATLNVTVADNSHLDDGSKGMTYFIPPTNGNYRFHIRGDDGFMMRINTNGTDPLAAMTVAYRQAWVNADYGINSGNPPPAGINGPIYLEGGKPYWLEVIQKNGNGGDFVAGTFRAYSDSSIPPNTEDLAAPNIVAPVGPAYIANVTPSSLTIEEGGYATFTASGIGGALPYYARWFVGGNYVPAASNKYSATLGPFGCNDTNVTFVVSNFWSVGKFVVPVTVLMDTNPPLALSATGNGLNHFYVVCSARMDPVSAADITKYDIPGLTVLGAGIYNGNTIAIRTSSQTPGQSYSIALGNVKAGTCTGLLMDPTNLNATTEIVTPGVVWREFYTGIEGNYIRDLTNHTKYLDHTPDLVDFNNTAMTPDSWGTNFGAVISGYVVPPVSGPYTFYMVHDDGGQFLLSTDDGKENLVLQLAGDCCHNSFSGAFSKMLSLTAGKHYYFEGRVKEGAGADALRIGVRTPLDPSGVPSGAMTIIAVGANTNFFQPPEIGIIQPPLDPPVTTENTYASFSVVATNSGVGNQGYQWQRYVTSGGMGLDGQWVDIYGATGTNLNLLVTCNDDGLQVRVRITVPGTTVYSDPATNHVVPDIAAPVIVDVLSDLQDYWLTVIFNEKVTPESANNPANYSFSGGIPVLSAELQADQKSVLLTLDGHIADGNYTVTATNVSDIACVPNACLLVTSPEVRAPWPRAAGYVQLQFWNNIVPPDQINVNWYLSFLTGDPRYPYSPDLTLYTNISNWPQTDGAAPGWENYGMRMTGVIVPPGTGNYTFRIVADDSARMTIGKYGDLSKDTVILNADSAAGGCAACSGITSSPYPMNEGEAYMFEVLFLEATGGDYLSLTWSGPNLPAVATNIFETNLWFTVDPRSVSLTTVQHPVPTTILEGRQATFTAQVTASVGIPHYQWQYSNAVTGDWMDIPGANNPAYTTDYSCLDASNTQYRAVVGLSLVNGLITRTNITDAALLTVLPDSEVPLIVSVGSLDGSSIGVVFSEPVRVRDETFSYPYNWRITDSNILANLVDTNDPPNPTMLDYPVTVVLPWPDTNATYSDKVVLHLLDYVDWSAIGIPAGWDMPYVHGPFTVECGFAVDTACVANDLGTQGNYAGSMGDSVPVGLTLVDIWSPQPPGSAFVPYSNRVEVAAGGYDIWNFGDQFTYLQRQVDGDFDARVTVMGIPDPPAMPPNTWSKAAIMVRGYISALDGTNVSHDINEATNSMMAYIAATPTNGVNNFASGIRHQNNTSAVDMGPYQSITAIYPTNAFPVKLRLVREGTNLTTYYWGYVTNIDTNVPITTNLTAAWVRNASAPTTNWPSLMYVGLATTSHSQSNRVKTTYEDFQLIDRPTITVQPQGVTNAVPSADVVLSVGATGPEEGNPLRYQWFRNGGLLAGETSSSLTLTNPTQLVSGDYTVEVRNSAGAVLSTAASVLIMGPPIILTQPLDAVADCFGSHTFTVAACCSNPGDPLTYQWFLDRREITGETGPTLTVINLTADTVGPYSVVVSNASGPVTSRDAWLSLTDDVAPTIICPDNMSVECGTLVTYSVTAFNSCNFPVGVNCTPSSGQVFPVGPTTVNCTTVSSIPATCSFLVTVTDTQPPAIANCSTNITTTNAVVSWPDPTATDGCPGVVTIVCTPPSGSTFPLGTNEVVCQATDASGNSATCSFTVTVQSAEPPISLTIAREEGGVLVSWPETPPGYELFYTLSLGVDPAAFWTNYPGPFSTNTGTISTSVSVTNNTLFFRLQK